MNVDRRRLVLRILETWSMMIVIRQARWRIERIGRVLNLILGLVLQDWRRRRGVVRRHGIENGWCGLRRRKVCLISSTEGLECFSKTN